MRSYPHSTEGTDTDGYQALVLDTALRTRYPFDRRAADVKMMEPHKPVMMMIDMWHTAITFEKGHRLAVHITSSNRPRFEVNPNTGEPPDANSIAPREASNTIFHNAQQSTALVMFVLAREKKSQITNKSQITTTKTNHQRRSGVWNLFIEICLLEFVCDLAFVVWDLLDLNALETPVTADRSWPQCLRGSRRSASGGPVHPSRDRLPCE